MKEERAAQGLFARLASSRLPLYALLLAATLAAPAVAQTPGKTGVAEIALYEGADRPRRLLENARKEGSLSVYTSATVEDMAILTAAFEKKYGIKANVWRAA